MATDAGVAARADVLPAALVAAWRSRLIVPYLGPGVLGLVRDCPVPRDPEALVQRLVARVSVPYKLRNRLTAAAQFIENFKHRKTLAALMGEAFAASVPPTQVHRAVAALAPPLVVDAWYDDATARALADAAPAGGWGQVQGLSQAEHAGRWTGGFAADGAALDDADPGWGTLLYKPIGGVRPATSFLVSDSDFVEVLTEIDIQTPIPAEVQRRRAGLPFLFLGCRFNDQLTRSFARQVAKRSAPRHWALLSAAPTRMEERFLAELNIERIALPLDDFLPALRAAL